MTSKPLSSLFPLTKCSLFSNQLVILTLSTKEMEVGAGNNHESGKKINKVQRNQEWNRFPG